MKCLSHRQSEPNHRKPTKDFVAENDSNEDETEFFLKIQIVQKKIAVLRHQNISGNPFCHTHGFRIQRFSQKSNLVL